MENFSNALGRLANRAGKLGGFPKFVVKLLMLLAHNLRDSKWHAILTRTDLEQGEFIVMVSEVAF